MTQMRNRSGGGGSGRSGGWSRRGGWGGGDWRGSGGATKALSHSPVATVAISVDSWIIAVQPRWATAITSFGHAVGTSCRRSGGSGGWGSGGWGSGEWLW